MARLRPAVRSGQVPVSVPSRFDRPSQRARVAAVAVLAPRGPLALPQVYGAGGGEPRISIPVASNSLSLVRRDPGSVRFCSPFPVLDREALLLFLTFTRLGLPGGAVRTPKDPQHLPGQVVVQRRIQEQERRAGASSAE